MSYIGTDINYGNLAKQTGTGDGADTTPIAALTYTVPSSESILVFLDGVCQVPATDFTATGTTLTFTTAPANGVAILVMFLGRSLDIGTPADNTVATAKLVNNAVDETKLKDALIGDFSDATVTASDTFLHGDATDSGNTKRDTVQGILDLAGGGDLRNFIIDGDFTQWPEGTTATTPATSKYKSALMEHNYSHDGTHTAERSTDVPTTAESSHQSAFSHLVKCTGTDASIGAGQHLSVRHYITGSDFAFLHKQQVTISFWAKTASANSGDTYCGYLSNGGSNRSYVWEFSPTNSWTKFTKTITLDTSGTWNDQEGHVGMVVGFTLATGSTYHGTADSWEGEQDFGTSSIGNFLDSTSNEFYLSQFCLVLGSSAPDSFLGQPVSTVKDQVEYYVEEKVQGDADGLIGHGYFPTTSLCRVHVPFRSKRAAPTITSSSTGTHYGVFYEGASANPNDATRGHLYIGKTAFDFQTTFASVTTTIGFGGAIRSNSASCYILLDARH